MGSEKMDARIAVRAVRVDTELWEAAKDAAQVNGEALSEAIRRDLRRYVKATERKLREGSTGPPS